MNLYKQIIRRRKGYIYFYEKNIIKKISLHEEVKNGLKISIDISLKRVKSKKYYKILQRENLWRNK